MLAHRPNIGRKIDRQRPRQDHVSRGRTSGITSYMTESSFIADERWFLVGKATADLLIASVLLVLLAPLILLLLLLV